jgi:hypothetical protein
VILTARSSVDQYPDGSDGVSSGLREALKAAVKGLERLPPEDLLSRSPAIAQCNRAAMQAAVSAAWTAQHQFGGALLGEHLGQLLVLGWSVTVAVMIVRSRVLPTWVGWAGLVASGLYLLNQGDILATAVPGFPGGIWPASSAARHGPCGSSPSASPCSAGTP